MLFGISEKRYNFLLIMKLIHLNQEGLEALTIFIIQKKMFGFQDGFGLKIKDAYEISQFFVVKFQ